MKALDPSFTRSKSFEPYHPQLGSSIHSLRDTLGEVKDAHVYL